MLVQQDESRPFARVYSQPIAQIDRLRYLLLLWPEDGDESPKRVEIKTATKIKSDLDKLNQTQGKKSRVSE